LSQPHPCSPNRVSLYFFLNAVKLSADALFFFMDCAVSEFAFSRLVSATSAGWLAINAFLTAARLLINDLFWIDMVATLSLCCRVWNWTALDDFDNCGDYEKPVASLNTYFFFFMAICARAPALLGDDFKLRIWSAFAVRVFDWPMAPVSTGLVVSFFSAGRALINDLV